MKKVLLFGQGLQGMLIGKSSDTLGMKYVTKHLA